MKKNLLILASITLVLPQVYIYADESKPMGPPPNGQYMMKLQEGQERREGQWENMGGNQGGMMGQEGGQMLVDPREGKKMNKMIEPTGGSKMLPPFGNEGVMNGSGGNMEMNRKPPMNGSGMYMPPRNGSGYEMPKMNSGAMADKMEKEIATRKATIEYLATLGADTSVFTDAVIADGAQFWKALSGFGEYKEQLAKYMAELKRKNNGSGAMVPPPMKDGSESMMPPPMKEGSGTTMSDDNGNKKQSVVRPALTEKARKLFQEKLDKIPSEKRDTLLPKMLKNAEAQIAKAEEKGNKTLLRKLQAMLEMIQDEIDSADDKSLIDSLMAD